MCVSLSYRHLGLGRQMALVSEASHYILPGARPLAANLQVAVRQHQANDEFGAFDQIGLPSLDGLGL